MHQFLSPQRFCRTVERYGDGYGRTIHLPFLTYFSLAGIAFSVTFFHKAFQHHSQPLHIYIDPVGRFRCSNATPVTALFSSNIVLPGIYNKWDYYNI
jgi:hypothetical protein